MAGTQTLLSHETNALTTAPPSIINRYGDADAAITPIRDLFLGSVPAMRLDRRLGRRPIAADGVAWSVCRSLLWNNNRKSYRANQTQ